VSGEGSREYGRGLHTFYSQVGDIEARAFADRSHAADLDELVTKDWIGLISYLLC